jgi:predicted ATPase
VVQGGEGQVVLLAGEPGIGNSPILSELRGRLEAEHATNLRLHCSPYYAYSAILPDHRHVNDFRGWKSG